MNINSHDLLIDVENEYVKKTKIGLIGICTIPDENIILKISDFSNQIFLKTKYKQFLWLKNKKTYKIECEKNIIDVWLCKIISLDQFLKESDIKLSEEEKNIINLKNDIELVDIIYGRCVNSMIFLDKVYRDYIYRHKFKNNEIVAIKSVAGSGKTTTLLELAKIHNNKKILYIAFNKSLITEIKSKIKEQSINNLLPVTFDALMRDVFINKSGIDSPGIIDLKPHNIGGFIDWFSNKPYRIKNFYIKNFSKFCNQTEFNNITDFSNKILGNEKKLLITMWQKAVKYELITFDSIRKLVEINQWCKNYVDNRYDMIFIDESQDFDNTMLKILLEDTNIPKLFVGDPMQAIYEWKGCINAFDNLPSNTLIIEFYSTFRVGLPACNDITEKFNNCWMISRSNNITNIEYDQSPTDPYVYLFRSWKNLLKTAQYIPNIWIHNYDSQVEYIKRLHNKLQISNLDEDELNEFSDDLPMFLLKLSLEDLEKLINNIDNNLVEKNESTVQMYTIHSYKGLEDNIIRIFNDIDIKKEENLYYVALTRGKKRIILDTKTILYDDVSDNKKQTLIENFGIKKIPKITQSKRKNDEKELLIL